MSLFVVEHKHTAESCPAGHPEMGPMLLKHISPANAATFGVKVQAEAVIDGAHIFYLIVEADDEEKVKKFMAPFSQAGSVEISPASYCEQVVQRKLC